jgi:cell division septum initiation protein DivIVA
VDAFLDLVVGELARLLEQINDLTRQVEQRDRQLRVAEAESARAASAVRPPNTQPVAPVRDHDTQAAKVLGMAQQIADRLTGDAKAEANGILSEARANAEQLLSEARTKADGMVNEARSRAQTMVDSAHGKAAELDRQSKDKAAALDRDAERKHAEIIGSISHEKAILEKKIAELRTFENEYRTRMKTYLESQLRELELRAFAPPAESARPAQDSTPAAAFRPPVNAGSHRADPQYGSGVAEVARIPAPRNGSADPDAIGEAGMTGMRWEPAV